MELEVLYPEEGRILLQLHRRLLKAFMDILILAEIKKNPVSGYDVITSIYRKYHLLPSSGSVYSLLYALERRGLVKGGWDERRRIYMLTQKGEKTVEETLNSYRKIENFLTKIFMESSY